MQANRGVASEWPKQVERATGTFTVLGFLCVWRESATLQEQFDQGSKLFQDKSLYRPALHQYLQELLRYIEMAYEILAQHKEKQAAEGAGSGGAFQAAPARRRERV